ncbi:hypothetical protein CYLTODRAFT_495315 [Cylindrobasidium torrendii FP15055 ss-10]|uniref:Uncharacterized protein n=1 Tax=Cylindrobasidium torrendii FP15055 ss-10 TaxID=1314674 RepID=A0A0D7ASZ2_9AGAR|nr:hypothetical protein CYLTODRAFT_495315 [Cylindrobasidium torrendii FP15055 ss-10]
MDLDDPIVFNSFSPDYDYRGELQHLIDIAIFPGSEHTACVRITDLIHGQPTPAQAYRGGTGVRVKGSALAADASQPDDVGVDNDLSQDGCARTDGADDAALAGTGLWPWVNSAYGPNVLKAFIKVFIEVMEWVRLGRHSFVPSRNKDRKLHHRINKIII